MNIALSDKEQAELGKLVSRWARRNKLIAPGEQLAIQLTKRKIEPVVFLPIKEEEPVMSLDEIDRILATPIDSLGLSKRALGPLLETEGLATIGLVARQGKWGLLKIINFGGKSSDEVTRKLTALGISPGVNYQIGKKERSAFLNLFVTDKASWNYLQLMLGTPDDSPIWTAGRFLCGLSGLRWRDLRSQNLTKLALDMLSKNAGRFRDIEVATNELSSLFAKLEIP